MLEANNLIAAGVVLLTMIFIAYGGTYVLSAKGVNDLQKRYFRAGHGHAGMLVTLGLVVMILVQANAVPEPYSTLSSGVLWAGILMPAGFFLSIIGQDPQRPNRLISLLWLGVGSLVIGLGGAGIGLIVKGLG